MITQRRRVLEGRKKLVIPANGVYIEGLDGKVYSIYLNQGVDVWQSGKTANSIIVASGDVKFRIALTQPSRMGVGHYSSTLENYMTAITGETAAKADYNGSGNTVNIMKSQPSTNYAAGYCNGFTFPDGRTKGYLPSLGQLNLAYQNKYVITLSLNRCGGTALAQSYYWSSTFAGVNGGFRDCWELSWGDGGVNKDGLTVEGYVRPFADLT